MDDLDVGMIVNKRRSPIQRKHKLESEFIGPYWIVRKLRNGCYWIQGLNGNTIKINRKDPGRVFNQEEMEFSM